jgi:hypothetical protein
MPNGQVVDASELLYDNEVELEPEHNYWVSASVLTLLRLYYQLDVNVALIGMTRVVLVNLFVKISLSNQYFK